MNLTNLQKVRDVIVSDAAQFDMSRWLNPNGECGTVACIAGHAYLLHCRENEITPMFNDSFEVGKFSEQVCDFLGISLEYDGVDDTGEEDWKSPPLFYTDRWPHSWLAENVSAFWGYEEGDVVRDVVREAWLGALALIDGILDGRLRMGLNGWERKVYDNEDEPYWEAVV
jgi:hypothetical protein